MATRGGEMITQSQLNKARLEAKKIYKDFLKDLNQGEQSWNEIEINEKYFDIECFDDDMGKPRTDTYCSIYATYPTQCGTWRETDGTKFIRLFTNKESNNE
jgi:hypothetical protein